MCCGEQRTSGKPTTDRDENRFAAPEIVQHCGDAVGSPAVTGSDTPVPGWSKKMNRPSDVIASTQP
jgi:hypothetical protein